MGWFRFYDEALDDPKVQSLDPVDFKHWVNLLCIAKRYNGRFGNVSETAFHLRLTVDACSTLLSRLIERGLIDKLQGGADGWHYAPHAWEKRQYISDTSTDRVQRFRQRSTDRYRNGVNALHETGSEYRVQNKNAHARESKKSEANGRAHAQGQTFVDFSSDLGRKVQDWHRCHGKICPGNGLAGWRFDDKFLEEVSRESTAQFAPEAKQA